MNRPLWLGLGLILASNAIALAGVWYNRSGEPQAQLQLSEREIQLPYDSWLRAHGKREANDVPGLARQPAAEKTFVLVFVVHHLPTRGSA